MHIEQARANVFTVTATSQELAALVAGARMALDIMRRDTARTPPEAAKQLEAVLDDFERAAARIGGDG
jgi:hypothetical protein